jgi:hypothetical protein
MAPLGLGLGIPFGSSFGRAMATAWGTITGTLSNQTDLQNALDAITTGYVPNTRAISTTAPLTGGGDLSADRTLSIPVATNLVDGYLSSTDWNTFNGKVTANGEILAETKTKITYDEKGLITYGDDATTEDIADSTDRRYVTDAQLSVIAATSGTNTGDQDLSNFVPFTGATESLNLGANNLTVEGEIYFGNDSGSLAIETDAGNNAIFRSLGIQAGNFSGFGGLELYGRDSTEWGVLRIFPQEFGFGSFEVYGADPIPSSFSEFFRFRFDVGFTDPTGITFISEGDGFAYGAGDMSFVFGGVESLRLSALGTANFTGPVAIGNGDFVQIIKTITASLNFPSIAANDSSDLIVTLTGADIGDAVYLGAPYTLESKLVFCGWVSNTNQITVRLHNSSAGAVDPATNTWRIVLIKF